MLKHLFTSCLLSAIIAMFGAVMSFAQPVIAVEDWNFGQCLVGATIERSIRIVNQGDKPLIITDVYGPFMNAFMIKAGTMPSFPFTIPPNGESTFSVSFKPAVQQSYIDQIVFGSNAENRIDNICALIGAGIAPNLQVTSMEWGRLRVDLGVEGNGQLTLTNNGTATARIIRIKVDNSEDFTIVNPNSVLGDIAPATRKTLDVRFHPRDIGPHQMNIVFETLEEERIATLSGTGVYAQITTQNYDFGTVDIPGGTPTKRDVEFVVTDDVYSEAIEVTGFQMMEGNDGFFSYDIANNLFREDGTQVTAFPFVVPKGGRLILRDVTFMPTAAGVHTRSMRILTVDDTHPHSTNNSPVVSVWSGESRIVVGLDNTDRTTEFGMYPNPAGAGEPVQLTYKLHKSSDVCVAVADLLGRPVYLWQGVRSSGDQHHTVPGTLKAGCYTVTISADGTPIARSTIVIK